MVEVLAQAAAEVEADQVGHLQDSLLREDPMHQVAIFPRVVAEAAETGLVAQDSHSLLLLHLPVAALLGHWVPYFNQVTRAGNTKP